MFTLVSMFLTEVKSEEMTLIAFACDNQSECHRHSRHVGMIARKLDVVDLILMCNVLVWCTRPNSRSHHWFTDNSWGKPTQDVIHWLFSFWCWPAVCPFISFWLVKFSGDLTFYITQMTDFLKGLWKILSSSGSNVKRKVKTRPWDRVCNGSAHHRLFLSCKLLIKVR